MLSKLLCVLSLCFAQVAIAQSDAASRSSFFEAQGRLAVFRIVPGDKTLRLYVVGKETASLDFNKDSKILSITALENNKPRELKFSQSGDAIEIIPHTKTFSDITLNIKAEVRGQKEDVKVHLKP